MRKLFIVKHRMAKDPFAAASRTMSVYGQLEVTKGLWGLAEDAAMRIKSRIKESTVLWAPGVDPRKASDELAAAIVTEKTPEGARVVIEHGVHAETGNTLAKAYLLREVGNSSSPPSPITIPVVRGMQPIMQAVANKIRDRAATEINRRVNVRR